MRMAASPSAVGTSGVSALGAAVARRTVITVMNGIPPPATPEALADSTPMWQMVADRARAVAACSTCADSCVSEPCLNAIAASCTCTAQGPQAEGGGLHPRCAAKKPASSAWLSKVHNVILEASAAAEAAGLSPYVAIMAVLSILMSRDPGRLRTDRDAFTGGFKGHCSDHPTCRVT